MKNDASALATKKDIQDIFRIEVPKVINKAIQPMKKDINTLKKDVSGLKKEMPALEKRLEKKMEKNKKELEVMIDKKMDENHRHYEMISEQMWHGLLGANKDEIEVLKDHRDNHKSRIERLECRAGLMPI